MAPVPITFPLGSDPPGPGLATAHCHACLRTSIPDSRRPDRLGDAADFVVTAGASHSGFVGLAARSLSGDAAQRT
jgi:hypothetical protein